MFHGNMETLIGCIKTDFTDFNLKMWAPSEQRTEKVPIKSDSFDLRRG